jgi:hypothetical protein
VVAGAVALRSSFTGVLTWWLGRECRVSTLTVCRRHQTLRPPTGTSCDFDQASTLNPNFTCNDNGTFSVTLSVNDGHNPAVTNSATVTVANVPPTITSFVPSRSSALTGVSVTFAGQATDPSSNDLAVGLHWAFSTDGGSSSAFGSSNQLTTSFSTCGSHTASAQAQDKDGGTSAPVAASSSVATYTGAFQPPLTVGQVNVVKAGSVIPVKILVDCNGASLTTLAPAIQLIKGDVDGVTDTGATTVATTSASAADTTGVMRPAGPQYLYNLQVPTGYPSGTQFTIRIRPFGDGDPANGMSALIQTK